MKKILITYYSHTGTCARIASKLSETLECDREEVIDLKNRNGFAGFWGGFFDAVFRRKTEIAEPCHHPGKYDLVIIITPVWAMNMTPAIRTYLQKNDIYIKNTAFVCTCHFYGAKRTLEKLGFLLKKPLTTLVLKEKDVTNWKFFTEFEGFIKAIYQCLA